MRAGSLVPVVSKKLRIHRAGFVTIPKSITMILSTLVHHAFLLVKKEFGFTPIFQKPICPTLHFGKVNGAHFVRVLVEGKPALNPEFLHGFHPGLCNKSSGWSIDFGDRWHTK